MDAGLQMQEAITQGNDMTRSAHVKATLGRGTEWIRRKQEWIGETSETVTVIVVKKLVRGLGWWQQGQEM